MPKHQFDLLNSRNFLSKAQYKKPFGKNNEDSFINFMNSSIKYLKSLYCLSPGKDARIKENFIPVC